LTEFLKILKYQISLISLTGSHADGQIYRQTDMMKLIVAFRSFANALK